MQFSILDYIDRLDSKEYNTWIQATCPVCRGKLKINKNNGSYACYTNECHKGFPNKIRDKLFTRTSFNQKTSFTSVRKISTLVDVVKPLKDFSTVDPNNFLTSLEFQKPKSVYNNREGKLFTYFDYGQFQIVRIDYLDVIRDKDQYYQYVDSEGNLILDIPKTLTSIPIYNKDYLSKCVLFVEGEKSAAIGQKLGFNCITIPTFLYSSQHLNKVFSYLRKHITHLLVLNDNDETGIRKAKDICKYGWKFGINTDVLNLVNYYTEFQHIKGFDIYDLYKEKNITTEEILWLISLHLKTLQN